MNSTLTGDPIKQAIFTCHCRKLTRYRSICLTTHMYDQISPLLGIYKECIGRRVNTRKPSLAKPETLSPPPRERGLAPRMATRGEGRVVEPLVFHFVLRPPSLHCLRGRYKPRTIPADNFHLLQVATHLAVLCLGPDCGYCNGALIPLSAAYLGYPRLGSHGDRVELLEYYGI